MREIRVFSFVLFNSVNHKSKKKMYNFWTSKGLKKEKNKGNTIVHEQYRTNNTLKKQVTPYNLSSKNLYKTHTFIILNLQKNEIKTGKTDTIPYIKEKISRRIITPSPFSRDWKTRRQRIPLTSLLHPPFVPSHISPATTRRNSCLPLLPPRPVTPA